LPVGWSSRPTPSSTGIAEDLRLVSGIAHKMASLRFRIAEIVLRAAETHDYAATSGLGTSAINVSVRVAALPGNLHWCIYGLK
jgi:hypothetical protein